MLDNNYFSAVDRLRELDARRSSIAEQRRELKRQSDQIKDEYSTTRHIAVKAVKSYILDKEKASGLHFARLNWTQEHRLGRELTARIVDHRAKAVRLADMIKELERSKLSIISDLKAAGFDPANYMDLSKPLTRY
jgi:hypothetical protein